MDVNATVVVTDKLLHIFGISRPDLDVILFVALLMGIGMFFMFRHKCKDTVNCKRMDKAMNQVDALTKKLDKIHDMHIAAEPQIDRQAADHAILEKGIGDLKADLSLLRGIITGSGSLGNRRIIHGS